MSRYLLLFLLNVPFICAGIFNAVVSYKLKKLSRNKFTFQIILWLCLLVGLLLTQTFYNYLFSHKLTVSEPLSIFDVILTTGLIIVLFVSMRTQQRLDTVERRLHDLHQELSIKLSD